MYYASLVIVLSIMLLSCSKAPADDSSKREALTTGTWKLTGDMRDYNKDGFYEEDSYAILADCEKDNFYTFQADGSVIKDAGPTTCYSGAPQTITFSWSFQDSQTRLLFGGSNYEIEELTSTTLRLKGRVSYNIIYTIDEKSTYTKR